MSVDFAKLAAPFPPAAVSWRIGSTTADKTRGMALAYLDARDVMDRLDEACGADGWQATYPHAGQKTVCSIGILCGEHWVWKSNGAGDSDIEAEKGAMSDAFKRAAVLWGIGRYLYNLTSPWVEIETKGRTSVIKEHEYARLAAHLAKHSGPVRPAPEPPAPRPSPVDPRDQALVSNDGTSQYQVNKLKAATTWADTAIATLEMALTPDHVDQWRTDNDKALDRLEKNYPDLFALVDKKADEVRASRRAQAA